MDESLLARLEERLKGLDQGFGRLERAAENFEAIGRRVESLVSKVEGADRKASGAHDAIRLLRTDVIDPMQREVQKAVGGRNVLITLFCALMPTFLILATGLGAAYIKSREDAVRIQNLQSQVDQLSNRMTQGARP